MRTLPQDTGWMGDRRRGASMGRVDVPGFIVTSSCKFTLQRVPLNSTGYDCGGAYWGVGQPLWGASCDANRADHFFRARDRAAAKEWLLVKYPTATFYR